MIHMKATNRVAANFLKMFWLWKLPWYYNRLCEGILGRNWSAFGSRLMKSSAVGHATGGLLGLVNESHREKLKILQCSLHFTLMAGRPTKNWTDAVNFGGEKLPSYIQHCYGFKFRDRHWCGGICCSSKTRTSKGSISIISAAYR